MENEATGYGISRQALPVQTAVMTLPTTELSERYEPHHATVHRVALRVIGNPADAEECDDGRETEHPPRNLDHFREKL
jgi:hypothetical protein